MSPAIMWFRRDLRIRDNAALLAAASGGRPVIPVYVASGLDRGGASRWWLHHSLNSLDSALVNRRRYWPRSRLRQAQATSITTGATSLTLARRNARFGWPCRKRANCTHSTALLYDHRTRS